MNPIQKEEVASLKKESLTLLRPMVIFLIPLLLSNILQSTDLGMKGIWIGYPAAFIVGLGLQYMYYRMSWKKKKITQLIT